MILWRPTAALPAILATTLVFTAGCSQLGSGDGRDEDDDPVQMVALDPSITKLDEAAIGTSGPEQIEEAMEALDARTGTSPKLVRELGPDGAPLPEAGDLFERIRNG